MIPVQNVYYMLSYAFQVLNEQGYRDIATEHFENVAELCAAILIKGIPIQVKRGLVKEYIPLTDACSLPRGKISVTASLKTRSLLRKQLVCTYDDFTSNNYLNCILKTTMELLMRSDISKVRKQTLRRILIYFRNVDSLDLTNINWNIRYNRNNQSYRMLISICYLVIKSLLQTNVDGSTRLMDFLDEQRMCKLYEKFVLEYYRKEHPELTACAAQIPWQLDDGFNSMLPIMQSDIMLSKGNHVLIIDTKYYAHNTQTQYNTQTFHSENLYQIFTYVKNKAAEYGNTPHEVSGMLLYAKTDEENVQPNHVYHMSGNKISVRSLDLNCHFVNIAKQLDAILEEHFV